jgi:thioredoxin-dependent peroxiredoxin
MRKLITVLLFTTIFKQTTMAQKLKPNDRAPFFEVKSAQNETISLNNYRGKTVLITFFRFAGCPVCNFRMHELAENYNKLKAKNIELIAIFESNNETLQSYLKDYAVPFPVIGNPSLSLYHQYGIEKSVLKMMATMFQKKPKQEMKKGEEMYAGKKYEKDGSMIRIPADFVVDSIGNITTAHYGQFIGDHIALESLIN